MSTRRRRRRKPGPGPSPSWTNTSWRTIPASAPFRTLNASGEERRPTMMCPLCGLDVLPEKVCLNCGYDPRRSEEHTSELQSRFDLVCRLLLEKKKAKSTHPYSDTVPVTFDEELH